MDERPAQPPEGKLISEALAALNLSIREASRRAGISYGRWRQITSGYQNVSPGSYAAVRAPASTLARMARVAGVTPAELEGANRKDAADALRKILQRHDDTAETDGNPRWASLTPAQRETIQALIDHFESRNRNSSSEESA